MVEASEQRGSLGRDDGCFEVGACEVADGFKGAPVGFDDDFDFACEAKKRNRGTEVARDAAKFGQNILEKVRSEEHTSELQSLRHLVCRLLLEKKKSCAGEKRRVRQ